jgi:adenylate cyclase
VGRKQNAVTQQGQRQGRGQGGRRVRYPIGIKLVSIIASVLLISLGTVTVLMSSMFSEDLRVNAENTNVTVNRRSVMETENTLLSLRSNALLLLDTLDAAPPAAQAQRFFFERNPEVAAVTLDGRAPIVGEGFSPAPVDPRLVQEFTERSPAALDRARAGEMVLLNAAPDFGVPLLALFVPWEAAAGGGGLAGEGSRAAGIFFTAGRLAESFGSSVNSSFLINDAGEILVHPDTGQVLAGAALGSDPLARRVRANGERAFQILYTDARGEQYLGAYRKLSLAAAAVLTTVEYRLVFEDVAATTRRNVFLITAILAIAMIIIWVFAMRISKSLGRLIDAAAKIEVGQFDLVLTEKTHDELGLLSESFVKMGKALSSFSRFTNQEIVKLVMQGNLALGGEPRMATLLFTDIRSFTMISEMLEPWEVVEFLNSFMTRMITCVDETGGTVDKFMGDALMAHWGAVTIMDTPAVNALNAVKTALSMRSALRRFNSTRNGSVKQPRIRIGCGINTGPVVAGQIGSNQRMEYTVIGDTVNLANRTEAMNKPFLTDILITENTWNLIREEVIAEEMPPTKVKGKRDPVRMFAVINLRARPGEKQKRPVNLAEVRAMLGIGVPNLHQVTVTTEEPQPPAAR